MPGKEHTRQALIQPNLPRLSGDRPATWPSLAEAQHWGCLTYVNIGRTDTAFIL
jgi:hypothetical protein